MQSNRPLVLGLIVTVLAAIGLWCLSQGGEPPASPPPHGVEQKPVAPAPAVGLVDGSSSLARTGAAPATDAERTALAAGSGVDERLPGFVGRVVGPDGNPIAGAKVSAAAGLGFANANGQVDMQSFDLGNLEDIGGGFDPGAMLRSVREQLADRVETATDAEGRFRVVAKGTSRGVGLRVLVRGHGILDRRFERPREQDVDVGTLTLQAAEIVSGRVVTPTGTPIAGARVGRVFEIEQRLGGLEFDIPEMGEVETLRGGEAVVTDELGQFELAHLAPGDLTLRARHPEHPTAKSQPMKVEAGRELRSVLLTMQVGGVIAGVVDGLPADSKGLQVMAARKPKAEGDPTRMGGIAGVMGNFGVDVDEMMGEAGIGFGERTAAIGQDGRFEVRGLARDTYLVWVARTGGGFAGSTACSARVEAQPGGTVQLLFEPGVTVTFTVADAKSGARVERLTVRDRLRGGGGVADMMGGIAGMGGLQARRPTSYPDGAVTVANLRPKANQKLTLTIEALGYAPLERRDLELPKTGNLDLGVLALDPVPVLRVTVVAAHDGRPVQGASVRLVGGGNGTGPDMRGIPREFRRLLPGNGGGLASGRTDRDGLVTLNRPQQAATIEVDARGFAPLVSGSIVFSNEGPDAYSAQLRVGGAVAVTACDPADESVPGAFVEHRSPDGGIDSKKADGQGVARFENLTPGAHEFRLGKEGGALSGMMMRFGGRGRANGNAAAAEDGPPWLPVEVADQATATLRLVVQPTATLRGIVRENGLPLAGARVSFREGPPSGDRDSQAGGLGEIAERFAGVAASDAANRGPRTDEQGVYQMRELPGGEHHLRITHKSRTMPTTATIVLRNGENVFDVDLDLTVLRGVVLDPEGKPVDGARIRVRRPLTGGTPANDITDAMVSMAAGMNLGDGGFIKTDATGAFEVRGVDPDVELEILASAKGFAAVAARLTAARGQTTVALPLALGASGTVRVSVAGNQAFGTVRARWLGPGEGPAPVLGVLRRGKGTLEGLRPGPWEVSLESMESLRGRFGGGQVGQPQQPAEPTQKRTVEVIAGQTVDIEL